MKTRRNFLKNAAIGAAGVAIIGCSEGLITEYGAVENDQAVSKQSFPVIVSTWNHGLDANAAAKSTLGQGGTILDAVEAGVRITESDPTNQSVGLGGLPDRDGNVTLDACIMNHESQCGAVSFLQHIENPISVARKVMEETPHIMLSGVGAFDFALEHGFRKTDLLTEKSRIAWEEWKMSNQYQPKINSENHDTIGLLGIDADGRIAGACTTSGMAYKLHGRVGDSPIIGAGLFVDGEVGAACATGVGEAVIRIAGSAIVVELMRGGATPEEACKEAVDRIIRKHEDLTNLQVGFLALDKFGNTGAYSVYAGFNYAYTTDNLHEMVDVAYVKEWE
ncbi:MAG: N(4)-(beta-N-acetylglucosaminyl)-L-asparaginase [Flavobacteriales bacterium]|nr:N(4)-(beta-N-acetylglucosaminyl)-L-asparaginase [Flavobacteriales bacterium]